MAELKNRKELLALPEREWDKVTEYESIIIVPTGKKHDSGWALMAIIGYDRDKGLFEIAAKCDVIDWHIDSDVNDLAADMYYNNRCVRVFCRNGGRIRVGASLSTTDIEVLKRK